MAAMEWTDKLALGLGPMDQTHQEFVEAYNTADMVTGHYITGHDLPMINGALMECRMPPLGPTWVQDS